MAANCFQQNDCMQNEHLFLATQQKLVYENFLVTFQIQKQLPDVFGKKGVLRNFAKFTRKHLCQSLFFSKVAGLKPATLLKQRLWHKCFPVKFAKFLIIPFLIEHLRWLLLQISELEKIQAFQKLILREKFTFFQMLRYHCDTGAILFLKYFKNNFKTF